MVVTIDELEDPYESRQGTVIGVSILLTVVPLIAVGLRIYTRVFIVRKMGFSDWLAILALVSVILFNFGRVWNTQNGLGLHIATLDAETISKFMKNRYFGIINHRISLLIIKMTFITQYYSIIAISNMRKLLIAVTIVVFCWSLSQVFVTVFLCVPISAFWSMDSTGASCISTMLLARIHDVGNILTDMVIFVLPLPVLWKVKVSMGQKIILLGIFSLGFFVVLVSIFRCIVIDISPDGTWNIAIPLWSGGELAAGITCASLATLRPLSNKIPWLATNTVISGKGYSHASSSAETAQFSPPPSKPDGNEANLNMEIAQTEKPMTEDDESRQKNVAGRLRVVNSYTSDISSATLSSKNSPLVQTHISAADGEPRVGAGLRATVCPSMRASGIVVDRESVQTVQFMTAEQVSMQKVKWVGRGI